MLLGAVQHELPLNSISLSGARIKTTDMPHTADLTCGGVLAKPDSAKGTAAELLAHDVLPNASRFPSGDIQQETQMLSSWGHHRLGSAGS